MVLLVLLLLPILEIGAAILVAQAIGLLPTLLLLVGLSVLGVVLIRAEGLQTWRRANTELAAGRAPTDTLLDGLMVLVGGVLLIVPGFLTAVPGLLLLFPPTRALLRPVMTRWVERRAARSAVILTSFGGAGGSGGTGFGSFRIDAPFGRGPVVDADSHERRPSTAYAEVVEVDVDAPREIGPPT